MKNFLLVILLLIAALVVAAGYQGYKCDQPGVTKAIVECTHQK